MASGSSGGGGGGGGGKELVVGLSSQLYALLERGTEIVRRLSLTIYEFRDDGNSQRQVISLMQEYVSVLKELEETCKGSKFLIPIPYGLLQCVDEGRHPDGWLRTRLDALQAENRLAHGKLLSLVDFRNQLLNGLLQDASTTTLTNSEYTELLNRMANTGIGRNDNTRLPIQVMQALAVPVELEDDTIIDVS